MSWDEVVQLGQAVEAAGANIISTHFTWHESAVPTIATRVPRAAFAGVTGRLAKERGHSHHHQQPHQYARGRRAVLARGDADLVSMARPMLADPEFVNKAREGREDEINTCIACNQACLDHTFTGQEVSCLVNPRACHETLLNYAPTDSPKRIAVVGAGPAGLAYATVAAQRGHAVTLFDSAAEIGGQFNLAKRIPGKEEFYETLRYYARMIEVLGIDAAAEHARRRRTAEGGQLRPHRHRHRHRAAGARNGRHRSPQGDQLHRRDPGPQARGPERSPSWAPVALASTWPS